MSRIYINGINIPNVYVNGRICPAYFNGMLIANGSEPPIPTWTRISSSLTENEFLVNTNYSNLFNSTTVGQNDKIVLILRHSNRYDITPSEPDPSLTPDGVSNATNLGSNLNFYAIVPKNDIKYYATNYNRTKQTAQCIASGRDDTDYTDIDYHNIDTQSLSAVITGEYFKHGNDTSGYAYMGRYCSYPSTLTETDCSKFGISYVNRETAAPAQISNDAITILETILNTCSTNGKKMSVIISHDMYVVPFISWVARFNLSPNKFEWDDSGEGSGYWSNYMAGLAIIIHNNNTYEAIPFAGLGDGYKTHGWT